MYGRASSKPSRLPNRPIIINSTHFYYRTNVFTLPLPYGESQGLYGGSVAVHSPEWKEAGKWLNTGSWRCKFCEQLVTGSQTYRTHRCEDMKCKRCLKVYMYEGPFRKHVAAGFCDVSTTSDEAIVRRHSHVD